MKNVHSTNGCPDFNITSATSGLMESAGGLLPASIICLIFVPEKSTLSECGQTLSLDMPPHLLQ